MTQLGSEQKKEWYGEQLLQWYHHIKRDLPWRKNHDPYRIWVSEIMLQQTRVDTVIPYYTSFMEKFPTVEHLANAPEEEVLKSWEGLGYYSRARNLQAGAKMVMERHNGRFPTVKEDVAALKGVGPYTCGAIMSIAFNEPVPAVDGNVMRVISRFFALYDDIAKPATRVKLEKLVTTMIPQGEARYFNQALMELGALICTPKSPKCLLCPVMEHCEARLQGVENELPVKTKAKKARIEYRVAAIIEGQGVHAGKVLVRRRPDKGLLADMWELPHVLAGQEQSQLFADELKEQPQLGRLIAEEMYTRHNLLIKPRQWFCDQDHLFSHIHWNMRFFLADYDPDAVLQHDWDALRVAEEPIGYEQSILKPQAEKNVIAPHMNSSSSMNTNVAEQTISDDEQRLLQASGEELRFISKEDMNSLPFPNIFLKILQSYWQSKGED